MMKDFLRSNFMTLCLSAFILLLYPLLAFPKGALELLINQHHHPDLDIFFKYVTHLGDGSLLAVLLIGFLFNNYYLSILAAFSIILQAVFVSLFKRWLFTGMERPMAFFGEDVQLNFVDGVDVHTSNTFPSGHTATAFALFALLFIAFNNRQFIYATLSFILAFLVGLSRVYLLQHFVVDAYFGAVFGLLSVILGLYLMNVFFNDKKIELFKNHSLRTTLQKRKG